MQNLGARFRELAPDADYVSLRVVEERSRTISVRKDVPEPPRATLDAGAMVTVFDGDGVGHAATSDLGNTGLRRAIEKAHAWARLTRGKTVFRGRAPRLPSPGAPRRAARMRPADISTSDTIDRLMEESRSCGIDPRIVDWTVALWTTHVSQTLFTLDAGEVSEEHWYTVPSLHVTAHERGESQTRSWGGRYNGFCQQGGLDVLERAGFVGAGRRTAEESLALLAAPNCPRGNFDLVLMPDQMMLQIHESIGHPIELDRILGDERNFAGTSFVTLDMFGSYQYGSALLNVTYDPSRIEEFATFSHDDDGSRAEKQTLIERGRLLRPLGGVLSQQRAGIPGVATSRACSWNRPPIDRMSNLNVEPGSSTLEDLVASTDDGLLLRTNVSWSIDDSRNKFQFGCEWGQRIRRGRLAEVVRNPNYRGISATFWRSLVGVGNASTFEVLGTPYCGKGEPNQVIRVGHASPACKFSGVDVFGAEK